MRSGQVGKSFMKKTDPFLSKIEDSLFENLRDSLRAKSINGEKDAEITEADLEKAFDPAMLDCLADEFLKVFLDRAPGMLRDHRVADRGFERRNFKRWRQAFDIIETVLTIAEELGEACDIEGRDLAVASNSYQFEALSQIFPRAILVGREIVHLLKGGFPDAALSRWRSLHELTVTAMFISANDEMISLRYLAHFDFQARVAAKQHNKYAKRANLTPYSDAELQEFDERCKIAIATVGEEMDGPWDWARPVLPGNPTFFRIEEAVEMDHWRPRYKWASQHVHSGHRPNGSLLGACEAKEPLMLVGRSNGGFIDPLHMTAISIWQITSMVLLYDPTIDRVVYSKILMTLADRVAQEAIKSEQG